ncbi:MAG: Trm112 family protein [Armatimonadota bacterium]|nr:Trm112 family protein [Armatimonadota bacterium]
MPIDPKLLAILACPADDNRPPLRLEGETLVCDQCGRIYPIQDGIPILLPEEATTQHP